MDSNERRKEFQRGDIRERVGRDGCNAVVVEIPVGMLHYVGESKNERRITMWKYSSSVRTDNASDGTDAMLLWPIFMRTYCAISARRHTAISGIRRDENHSVM